MTCVTSSLYFARISMSRRILCHVAFAAALALATALARGQEAGAPPTPVPTPAPSVEPAPPADVAPGQPAAPAAPPPARPVTTPTPPPPARITDPSVVAILHAPTDNPFGTTAQVPASLPPKLTFVDATVSAAEFVSVRVDATGKPAGFRLDRDQGGDRQFVFTGSPPTDGTVPLESVDTPPMPKKTPWDADSYKGSFSAKFWVRVKANGALEKAIPLDASDPILVAYLRRAMSGWAFHPAQANGTPVDSWNELSLSGSVSYSVDLKQIASLRKNLAGS